MSRIRRGRYDRKFHSSVSHAVQDLIAQMLSVDPASRPTISVLMEHPLIEPYLDVKQSGAINGLAPVVSLRGVKPFVEPPQSQAGPRRPISLQSPSPSSSQSPHLKSPSTRLERARGPRHRPISQAVQPSQGGAPAAVSRPGSGRPVSWHVETQRRGATGLKPKASPPVPAPRHVLPQRTALRRRSYDHVVEDRHRIINPASPYNLRRNSDIPRNMLPQRNSALRDAGPPGLPKPASQEAAPRRGSKQGGGKQKLDMLSLASLYTNGRANSSMYDVP